MWSEALSLLEKADRLQRQFFRPPADGAHAWEPPIDVIETAEGTLMHVALPGVAEDSVAVEIERDAITVRGVRECPARSRAVRIHALEIPYGRFERRVALPMQTLTLAVRTLQNGCLTLTFARKETL